MCGPASPSHSYKTSKKVIPLAQQSGKWCSADANRTAAGTLAAGSLLELVEKFRVLDIVGVHVARVLLHSVGILEAARAHLTLDCCIAGGSPEAMREKRGV